MSGYVKIACPVRPVCPMVDKPLLALGVMRVWVWDELKMRAYPICPIAKKSRVSPPHFWDELL